MHGPAEPVRSREIRHLLGLLCLLLPFQLVAIHEQSLTNDEPFHLVAGYQALVRGRNTVNLEHPLAVKLLAAAPSALGSEDLAPPIEPDEGLAAADQAFAEPDALLGAAFRGRLVLTFVLTVPLWIGTYFLGRRFGGHQAGLAATAILGLSFSILPNLGLLQTDTAAALAFVLSALALTRAIEATRLARAGVLGLVLGIGLGSKFSAVLLGPAALLLLVAGRGSFRRRCAALAVAAATATLVVWLVFLCGNWSYSSEVGRRVIRVHAQGDASLVVADVMRPWEPILLRVEELAPFAAQWLTGLIGIHVQNDLGIYPSYALGALSSEGRSWYFPLLFLAKTPLVVLVFLSLGVLTGLRGGWFRRRPPPEALVVCVIGLTYLAASLTSSYNLGFRHLLPILPFLYLPAAVAAAQSRTRLATLGGLLLVEALLLTPFWMTATNTWWLGEANPSRFAFAAGNLEYRQNFAELQEVVEREGIGKLGIVFPLLDERVIRAYLPAAHAVDPTAERLEAGWYAVSVQVEQYLPALLARSSLAAPKPLHGEKALVEVARRWNPAWNAIRAGEDRGYRAGTFHLYYLPEPVRTRGTADPSPRPRDGTGRSTASSGTDSRGI